MHGDGEPLPEVGVAHHGHADDGGDTRSARYVPQDSASGRTCVTSVGQIVVAVLHYRAG